MNKDRVLELETLLTDLESLTAWLEQILEDIKKECGPLHYYPGSHRLPTLTMEDVGVTLAEEFDDKDRTKISKIYEKYEIAIKELIEISGIEKQILCIEKGDLLIWSANLLHGGEPIVKQGSTRFSQVTHYYFEGCRYYTPLFSDNLVC